jgi:hypothetical protein
LLVQFLRCATDTKSEEFEVERFPKKWLAQASSRFMARFRTASPKQITTAPGFGAGLRKNGSATSTSASSLN